MKIKKSKIIFLLAIFLVITPLLPRTDDLFQFKLKLSGKSKPGKEWIFLKWDKTCALEFESEDSFIRMTPCIEFNNGKIFILDNNLNKLVVFNRDGKFLGKAGEIGRGPGNIHFPTWMSIHKDKIFIANNNGIDIFGTNLKYINRIRTFIISYRFLISGDNIYTATSRGYNGKFPLFLGLNMNGTVETEFKDDEFEKSKFRYDSRGSIAALNDRLIFIPAHWNIIYQFDKNARLLKKNPIKYELLDRLEEWNNRTQRDDGAVIVWFCGMITSAKTYGDKLYILLGLPRLEIIGIDIDGNILEHFYNDIDFKYMRWYDFTVESGENRPVFYVMGISKAPEDKNTGSELAVFRVMPPGSDKTSK